MIKQLSLSEKIHYTNLWCREQGIKSSDLGCHMEINEAGQRVKEVKAHPAIDDVILLIKIRQEFWQYLNEQEKGIWAAYWSSTYHKGFRFNKKALKKIETITNSGIYKQRRQYLKSIKIKNLREHTTKWGCNMTAKGSPATTSLISG